MDNAGDYTLFAAAITTARTAEAQTAIDTVDMSSVTIVAEMIGGTSGTSISAWVQVSLDDGSTWFDVALFTWTNTASKKWCVLSGNAAKAVATYAALAAEGVNDGLLGTEMRAVITTVGVYANTTVSIRANVR